MKHSRKSVRLSYRQRLREAMRQFLPGFVFLGFRTRSDARWTPRMAAWGAILMAWDAGHTILDRFGSARDALTTMFPSRRRVGETYQGFIAALLRQGDAMLETVREHLRAWVQQIAGAYWTREGFVAFAADGSKIDCPRTEANEVAFGCGGRKGTGPQLLLTTLWHMGTGLPWDWRTGPATDAERNHLRQMLGSLPRCALLVADAGFTGYDLLRAILASGRSFLVRVGANVQLLKELGYAEIEDGQTVYLWPEKFRKGKQPPLVLRLIVLTRKGKKMYLVTDLPAVQLSDEQAAVLYEMRWGVEVFYRSLKQTLQRRKMLSEAPARVRLELGWTLVGLQLLGLLSVEPIIDSGEDPLCWSVAISLRVVRLSMRGSKPRRSGRGGFRGALSRAVRDKYKRRRSKKARYWPHKKRETPPGAPKIRNAKVSEVKKAQEIRAMRKAA